MNNLKFCDIKDIFIKLRLDNLLKNHQMLLFSMESTLNIDGFKNEGNKMFENFF